MHSPLEIAKNYVEIGIHKVRMSAWKMLVLGIFAECLSDLPELLPQPHRQP